MQKIAASLVKAQKEFGPALKTKNNPHLRAKYADLASCVEAVIDALNNNGIMLNQQTSECADGVIVETVFIHESGEVFNSGKLHVPASKHDPQGFGSALTYARRYSLMTACGIAPEDDDGQAATSKAPASQFDVDSALNQVKTATTSEALATVWKAEGAKAVAAKDKTGHTTLKNAVMARKAELEAS